MTTVLSQQLNKISLAIGKAPGGAQDAHVSVLYGAREAADTDTQTIYSNALHGLQQLSRADPRFLAYQQSLFSPATLTLDPGKLTAAELAGVHRSVKAFLTLLSPHFLSPGCFKTLEFLLRKYKLHSQCAEDLIACGLPFHGTPQFVRIVQATWVEGTAWEWLKPMQASGAPLPRATLAQRCVNDRALLKLICELAKGAGRVDHLNRMMVSLYAVLICEVLISSPKVDEDVVRLLLPYLLHGVGVDSLGGGVSPDYRTASHMILVQLCSIATLAKDFLEVLMQQIVKSAGQGEGPQVVMVLTHLMATQPHLTELPKSVIKALVKMEDLAGILVGLQQRKARSEPFVRLLVAGLCGNPKTTANSQALVTLLQKADLGFVAKQVAAAVLQQVAEKAEEADPLPMANLQQILRAVDLRYPEQSDAAINEYLQSTGGKAEQGAKIGSFVGGALSSSSRAPLTGQQATFSHAIDAPSAQLRIQAVKELDGLGGGEEGVSFVRDALSRRMRDDSPSVLLAAVSGKALLTLPPAEVVTAVAGLLAHARRQYSNPGTAKADKKVLRDIVRQALRVVVSQAAGVDAGHTREVAAACLVNCALASQSTQKLASQIPALARQLGHPLLAGVGKLGEKESGDGSGVGAANLATVRALAAGLADTSQESIEAVVQHLDYQGRCLMLLALNAASCQGSSQAAGAVLRMIGKMQAHHSPQPAPGAPPLRVPTFTEEGLPDCPFLEKLANRPEAHVATLFRRALLSALQTSGPQIEDAKALFERIGRLLSGESYLPHLASRAPDSYLPHLAALLARMGTEASQFLAAVVGQPENAVAPQKQVMMLELMPATVASGVDDKCLRSLVPCLLAAMCHPAQDVRSAALPAAEALANGLKGKNAIKSFLEKLAEGGKHIKGSDLGLFTLAADVLGQSAHHGSASKKKADTPRKGMTKAAAAEAVAFLTELLGGQGATPAGFNCARVLIDCLRDVASSQGLLSAGIDLLERLRDNSKPEAAEQQGEEVAKDVLSLFTVSAMSALEASRDGKTPSSVELLASLIAQRGESWLATSTQVQVAAISVVTPQLFTGLADVSQATLAMALLEAGSHSPDNLARIQAQKALEPLPLEAELLAPLLQPPALAPLTPLPTPKRSKKAKSPKTPSQPPMVTQEGVGDPWMWLSSALELLQWKGDVANSGQLLQPLLATLHFLLTQLRQGRGPGEEEGNAEAESVAADSSRWITSSDYLIQLTLSAMLGIASTHPDSKHLEAIDLGAVIQCTSSLTSAATRNTALLLLSKLASLRPKETLEVTLQVVAAVAELAQQQQDSQSLQVAADTLRAVAPAWISAGRGLPQLTEAALAAVEGLQLHRTLLLLSALASALPQEAGLQSLLVGVLGRASACTDAPDQERWVEIAGLLCKQVSWLSRVAAFRGLLEETLKVNKSRPEEGSASLATALVAGELGGVELDGGVDEGEGYAQNLQAILQNALQRLKVLGAQMAGALTPKQSAAVGATTKLIKALEEVMPRQQYLAALMALLSSQEEALVMRALRLFQSCLGSRSAAQHGEAAMRFCDQVAVILGGKCLAKVKQSVLVTLGTLAASHGKDSPEKVISTVPAVLTQVSDGSWALRSSALATLAAILDTVGHAIIPLLPRLVPPVLSAAVAAAEQLPEIDGKDVEMEDAADESSSDDERPSDAAAPRANERQQLEVQAALGAVTALIGNLGPFLSPHLPDTLHLLLDARLLHPGTPAYPLAAEARGRLCSAVPARLLLPALINHLDTAIKEGAAPVCELLQLTGRLVDTLDSAAASAAGDAVWGFALGVLDFRQEPPAGLGSVRPVEESALQLVMSLTLKLTESCFKPMFMRLVDWAAMPPASGVAGPERQIVLFKLVNALAQQLRGVFVPYYRHLLGLMTSHLASTSRGKRKRSHTHKPSSAEAYAGPDAPFLRLQVVLALHKCFLFDQGGFLDEPLFNRLVTPLVAQLAFHFPADVAARELDPVQLPSGPGVIEGLDVFGLATVEAIVQMAVSVRVEAMWKPLHHQVLMCTRSDDAVERRRALEVILQLVGRLGEEYVMLLPEAMPFLAELLEDPELHIQNGTRELLRKLEEMTGENLDEYLKM